MYRNALVTTTAVHGIGLPVRLRLLALLIAVAIAVVSPPFAPAATEDGDLNGTHGSRGFGRHAPFLPAIEDAE